MAKTHSFTCTACGASFSKWSGRCEGCGAWNSIAEEAPLSAGPASKSLGAKRGSAIALTDLSTEEAPPPRTCSGLDELDRVRLTIADGSHEHLTTQLRSGQLDMVLGRLGAPETMRGLSFTQLYLEDVAVVVRPGHPLLEEPDLRRITEWQVLYPPPWAAIRPFVERLLIAEGIPRPAWRIETVSGAFGRVYARQCDAVWFISAGVVASDIAEGRLARLPIATGGTEGPVGLMTRAGEAETPEQQLLRRAVDRALETLEAFLAAP